MTRELDVVVVGCGPAGASAARVVAAAGLEVVVLERKRVVGEPNHCGGGVSVECLREAGFEPPQPWIEREVPGCRVVLPDGGVIDFPRRGFLVDRPAFDRALAARAAAAGAEIETASMVRAARPVAGGWEVEAGTTSYRARYLVGAGGPCCPVARAAGLASPILPALHYRFEADSVPAEIADGWLAFYQHEDLRCGYGWAFAHPGGELAVGAGAICRPRPGLDRLCRRLGLDPARRRRTEGGPIPFLARPPRLVAERLVLCGDAGGFTHPQTKGGVHGAVWSGRLAGEAVAEAAAAGDPTRLARFSARVAAHPSRSPFHLRVERALAGFDRPVLDLVSRVIGGHVYSDLPVGRCLAEMLRRPRPHLWWGALVAAAIQRLYRRSERFAW